MSCTNCKSSPCACHDHGLTTPCSYTDCDPGNEPCDEVVSEECVRASYASDQDIRIDDLADIGVGNLMIPGRLLTIKNNEPLAMTLQKIYLYLSDPDAAKEDDSQGHAAYYVYFTNVTNNSITVNWTGYCALGDDFIVNVSTDDGQNYTPFGAAILVAGAPTTVSAVVTGLTPATDYVIKITTRFGAPISQNLDSVKVHTKTLPL